MLGDDVSAAGESAMAARRTCPVAAVVAPGNTSASSLTMSLVDADDELSRCKRSGPCGDVLAASHLGRSHQAVNDDEMANDRAVVDPASIPLTGDRFRADRQWLVDRAEPRPAEIRGS